MKICGYDYNLKYKSLIDADESIGECRPEILEISLEKTLPKEMKRTILIHEIMEAIDYHHELRLKHNQIQSIAQSLSEVIQSNGLNEAFDRLLVAR